MTKKGHIPIRTCIGCRKKKRKGEMIWLSQGPEGVVWVYERGPHEGRGFYLCPDLGCLNLAKRRNRGVGFLELMDFRHPSTAGFPKSEKVQERGGRE